MNEISGIIQETLTEDYLFLKKLESSNKNLQRKIWSKFRSDYDHHPPTTLFKSHPRKISSDSELSRSSSPGSLNLASPNENAPAPAPETRQDFPSDELKIGNLNTMMDECARRDLRSKLTELYNLQGTVPCGASGDATRCPLPRRNPVQHRQSKSAVRSSTLRRISQLSLSTPTLKQKSSLPDSHRSDLSLDTFGARLKVTVQKCLKHIADIRYLIEKGIEADGDEDYTRRLKRANEFSTRFSRNYVYPVNRHLEVLREMKPNSSTATQKILSTFQLIERGLQAYHTHLPSSAGKCASDRVQNLLQETLTLCKMYALLADELNMHDQHVFIEGLTNHVELLMEDLEYNFRSNQQQEMIQKDGKKEKSGKTKTIESAKKKKNNSLSMYHASVAFRKDAHFRKTMDMLTKKRYNVKSRYRTASYKHRPPVERPMQITAVPLRMQVGPRKSSGFIRSPLVRPVDEDRITTAVQAESRRERAAPPANTPNSGNSGNSGTRTERGESEVMQVQVKAAVNHDDRGGDGDSGGGDAGNATRAGNCGAAGEAQRGAGSAGVKKRLSASVESREVKEDKRRQRKEPKITVTGVKNAKLYCICDENSIEEASRSEENNCDESKENDGRKNSKEIIPLKNFASSETQTDIGGEERVSRGTQKASRTNVKISRLPKVTRRKLELIDSNRAVNIIQYKLDFKNYSKGNPMYDKSSAVMPWVLMGKVSDRLLEYALLDVTKEMEIDGLLEDIYHAEFQY